MVLICSHNLHCTQSCTLLHTCLPVSPHATISGNCPFVPAVHLVRLHSLRSLVQYAHCFFKLSSRLWQQQGCQSSTRMRTCQDAHRESSRQAPSCALSGGFVRLYPACRKILLARLPEADRNSSRVLMAEGALSDQLPCVPAKSAGMILHKEVCCFQSGKQDQQVFVTSSRSFQRPLGSCDAVNCSGIPLCFRDVMFVRTNIHHVIEKQAVIDQTIFSPAFCIVPSLRHF
jgi:hypothetical protein